jgi:PKD repeat protein
LYQAPWSFVPLYTHRYATSSDPLLAWSDSAESWGLPHYSVDFDGTPLGQTYGTQLRTPTSVAQGLHTWEVTATNQAGLTTAARAATVFVDTVAPTAALRLSGARRMVGVAQQATVTDNDPASPGDAASTASGIGTVQLRWGDGTKVTVYRRPVTHAYERAGRYVVTVTVTDRAGNRTVKTRTLTIAPKPKPTPKPRKKMKQKAMPKTKSKSAPTPRAQRGHGG